MKVKKGRIKTLLIASLLVVGISLCPKIGVYASNPGRNYSYDFEVGQDITQYYLVEGDRSEWDECYWFVSNTVRPMPISNAGSRGSFNYNGVTGSIAYNASSSSGGFLIHLTGNASTPFSCYYGKADGSYKDVTFNFTASGGGTESGAGNVTTPDSDSKNGTATSGAATAKPMDPAEAARLYAWIASGYNNDLLNPPANTHNHSYEWVEIKAATEDENGEYVYKCNCGNVLYSAPSNAMGVFVKDTIEKIQRAGNGATVVIDTKRWYSFSKSVFDALAARPDVTLTVNYLSEGYKGDPMTFTIPAGTDVSTLPDEKGFAGFTFLGGIFGATPR